MYYNYIHASRTWPNYKITNISLSLNLPFAGDYVQLGSDINCSGGFVSLLLLQIGGLGVITSWGLEVVTVELYLVCFFSLALEWDLGETCLAVTLHSGSKTNCPVFRGGNSLVPWCVSKFFFQ